MKYAISAFVSILSAMALLTGCNDDCYNPNLEKEWQTKVCPVDSCPGVIGCDEKTYCNECEANKSGVAVKN
jgi:hypothetical protein